jgi:hypothetical protein
MAGFPTLVLQEINDPTKFPISFQKWLLQVQNYLNGLAVSPVGTAYGGTGLTSFTQGDLIYSSATDILSKLPKSATATRYLANTGTSNAPKWDQVNLTNGVTGLLPYSSIQNVTATSRILGRATTGAGVIEELTIGSGLSLAGTTLSATGSGGDVVGPGSAVNGNVVLFDGTTGKIIKDGGTLGTAAFTASTAYDTAGAAASAQAASQPLNAKLTSISALVSSAGWLHNDGSGNYVYSTPVITLTGPITSVGSVTSVASQTGTGSKFVMDTGPTIDATVLTGNTVIGFRGNLSSTNRISVSGVTTIYSLQTTSSVGSSAADVLVNGYEIATPTNSFVEKVTFLNGAVSAAYATINRGAPAARTYSVSGSSLRLTMASGTYNVACIVLEQAC